MIRVEYRGELVKRMGKSEEWIAADSIEALMKEIRKRYSKEQYLSVKRSYIAVDGSVIQQKLLQKTKLKANDRVVFYAVCCGG